MINSEQNMVSKVEKSLSLLDYHFTHEQSLKTAKALLDHINYDCILINLDCFYDSVAERLNEDLKTLLSNKGNKSVFIFTKNITQKKAEKLQNYDVKPLIDLNDSEIELSKILSENLEAKTIINESVFTTGSLKADFSDYSLKIQNHKIHLTPIEFKIFMVLLKNPNTPMSRKELHESLCKDIESKTSTKKSRRIDAHISNLRRKLGSFESILGSVYGKGYVLRQSFL